MIQDVNETPGFLKRVKLTDLMRGSQPQLGYRLQLRLSD